MYDYDRRTAAVRQDNADHRIVTAVLARAVVMKTIKLIAQALKMAETTAHNAKFNEGLEVGDLKDVEKPLTEVAAWMTSHREQEAPAVKEFAELTSELVKKTKFWNRPVFLNKGDHAADLDRLYKQMKATKDKVMQAFKASGAWNTTAPAF